MTSPDADGLGFTSNHLRSLAALHRDAAAEISQVADLANGIAASIHRSHGLICLESSEAAAEAEVARRMACLAMESVSQTQEWNLLEAAARYETTDQDERDSIDMQMRTR